MFKNHPLIKSMKDPRHKNFKVGEIQSKHFCGTLNNYQEKPDQYPTKLLGRMNYLGYGLEEAPSTGTPHLQMYCQFKTKTRFSVVLGLLGPDWSIEPCKGSDEKNFEYITKINTDTPNEHVYQFGERLPLGRPKINRHIDIEGFYIFISDNYSKWMQQYVDHRLDLPAWCVVQLSSVPQYVYEFESIFNTCFSYDQLRKMMLLYVNHSDNEFTWLELKNALPYNTVRFGDQGTDKCLDIFKVFNFIRENILKSNVFKNPNPELVKNKYWDLSCLT